MCSGQTHCAKKQVGFLVFPPPPLLPTQTDPLSPGQTSVHSLAQVCEPLVLLGDQSDIIPDKSDWVTYYRSSHKGILLALPQAEIIDGEGIPKPVQLTFENICLLHNLNLLV